MARSSLVSHALVVLGAGLVCKACLYPDYVARDLGTDASAGGTGASAGSGGASAGSGGTAGGSTSTGGAGGAGGTCNPDASDACVGSPENCTNGIDDDLDGFTDCNDSDCVNAPACVGICENSGPITCGAALVAQRTDGSGSTSRLGPPAYGCTSTNYPGPERAHLLQVPAGQTVFLEAYGLDADVGLFLVGVNKSLPCHADFACTVSDVPGTAPEALSFTSTAGRDYYVIVDGATAATYSLVAQCSSPSLCKPTRAIEAGQTIAGTTALAEPNVTQVLASSSASAYSCIGSIMTGPEATFMFTPTVSGSYKVDLTNLTGNLNLIVLSGPACGTTCVTATSYSINPTTQAESVTFTATAGTTYYFAIDSFSTAVTTFDLTVTAL